MTANGLRVPLPFNFLISLAFFIGALLSILIASIAMMGMLFLERIKNNNLCEM